MLASHCMCMLHVAWTMCQDVLLLTVAWQMLRSAPYMSQEARCMPNFMMRVAKCMLHRAQSMSLGACCMCHYAPWVMHDACRIIHGWSMLQAAGCVTMFRVARCMLLAKYVWCILQNSCCGSDAFCLHVACCLMHIACSSMHVASC